VPNSLLTIDMITRKSLEILENNLVLSRNINRQYDDSFAKEGAKIGANLRIRLPDRALVTEGAALQVQDDNEPFTTLAISSQKHIGVNFTTAEMALSLDDFAERVLKPRISQLASSIDADVANVYRNVHAAVGAPGTTPSTSQVLLRGQQKLNEAAAPLSPRFATVNPAANAELVEGLKGLFNPGPTVSRQFKTGMMGEGVLGYDEINMSQSIKVHTFGTRAATGATVTTTVSVQGQATVNITGTGSQVINRGDTFTIANVNAVNPQTRETTGALQQFTVLAANTASGGAYTAVSISPAIFTAVDALATVDAFPQSGAAIVFDGVASTSAPVNLIYHRDAFTLATADLLLPQGVDMASRQVHNGISMRIVRDYDINNDRMPCRIDVLYGYAAIRPALAVRLYG